MTQPCWAWNYSGSNENPWSLKRGKIRCAKKRTVQKPKVGDWQREAARFQIQERH